MKVLIVNQSDISGGAGIAGYQLHKELSNHGVQSNLLVDDINLTDSSVHLLKRRRLIEYILNRASCTYGLNYLCIHNSFSIKKLSLYKASDIINLHNLHGGYFNYLSLPGLTKRKPAVFTLHDMWSFTGHCAYSFECSRWETGCGKCPHLDTYPEIPYDNTALEWKLKRWVYNHSNLTIVTPSNWLKGQVERSMLSHFPIHHIPNGLDLNVYQPVNTKLSRSALGLPPEKYIILISSQNFKNPRKGSDLLIKAFHKLSSEIISKTVILALGEASEILKSEIEIPIVSLGYIGGGRLKALAYSAADLCVFPTRADNLPLVVQESLACGTPVVSFNVGGVPEIVRSGITGLLARPEDATDLANKIMELLEKKELRNLMKFKCREIAIAEYSVDLQAKRYIHLYKDVINDFDLLK